MYLRCISREQGKELLADIHGGDCGHHSSSRTLVGKAFRSGFYWPTALIDTVELVRRAPVHSMVNPHNCDQADWRDPFFLVYGAEVVLPHEVRCRSARVLAFDEAQQDAMRGTDLVLGEEHRREAALRAARY